MMTNEVGGYYRAVLGKNPTRERIEEYVRKAVGDNVESTKRAKSKTAELSGKSTSADMRSVEHTLALTNTGLAVLRKTVETSFTALGKDITKSGDVTSKEFRLLRGTIEKDIKETKKLQTKAPKPIMPAAQLQMERREQQVTHRRLSSARKVPMSRPVSLHSRSPATQAVLRTMETKTQDKMQSGGAQASYTQTNSGGPDVISSVIMAAIEAAGGIAGAVLGAIVKGGTSLITRLATSVAPLLLRGITAILAPEVIAAAAAAAGAYMVAKGAYDTWQNIPTIKDKPADGWIEEHLDKIDRFMGWGEHDDDVKPKPPTVNEIPMGDPKVNSAYDSAVSDTSDTAFTYIETKGKEALTAIQDMIDEFTKRRKDQEAIDKLVKPIEPVKRKAGAVTTATDKGGESGGEIGGASPSASTPVSSGAASVTPQPVTNTPTATPSTTKPTATPSTTKGAVTPSNNLPSSTAFAASSKLDYQTPGETQATNDLLTKNKSGIQSNYSAFAGKSVTMPNTTNATPGVTPEAPVPHSFALGTKLGYQTAGETRATDDLLREGKSSGIRSKYGAMAGKDVSMPYGMNFAKPVEAAHVKPSRINLPESASAGGGESADSKVTWANSLSESAKSNTVNAHSFGANEPINPPVSKNALPYTRGDTQYASSTGVNGERMFARGMNVTGMDSPIRASSEDVNMPMQSPPTPKVNSYAPASIPNIDKGLFDFLFDKPSGNSDPNAQAIAPSTKTSPQSYIPPMLTDVPQNTLDRALHALLTTDDT